MTLDAICEQLSIERINRIHGENLARLGGRPGGPKPGCVEGSVGGAATAAHYRSEGPDPDILIFLSHLVFYIAKNHCYVDGNKRVAFSVIDEVLAHVGLRLEATQDEAADFILSIADGVVTSAEEVGEWLTAPGRLVARLRPSLGVPVQREDASTAHAQQAESPRPRTAWEQATAEAEAAKTRPRPQHGEVDGGRDLRPVDLVRQRFADRSDEGSNH